MSKQVLEKCLNVKLQPGIKMQTSSSIFPQQNCILAAIPQGEKIGKVDCSKPSNQSKERNE
ncbi:hypothetical protein ACN23B_30155 (plasmid) [Anabaena sp. FACHB-709]|uniref:hypothetical protein n=1 Tax=Nostocaceae TaxID=1162 RepID=UPI0005C9F7ED|nr:MULTISPECIES: hypothetical protein [Nostocaceae]MBD2267028.1 hypothetical protein [Anabaena sp. FACHB-709]MBD2276578.1 hypothetical protein [Nostoc sp. PCC 7120 = FACHB-418]